MRLDGVDGQHGNVVLRDELPGNCVESLGRVSFMEAAADGSNEPKEPQSIDITFCFRSTAIRQAEAEDEIEQLCQQCQS